MDILLNPGPVNLSDRVRNALLKPDICHREEEFSRLQKSIREKLIHIYDLNSHWAAVLLTGSGTAAVEAMLTSLIDSEDHVLILENGVYGERMTRICQIYDLPHTIQTHGWEEPVNIELLNENLRKGITKIALVHHETTTGRLNNIEEISNVARKFQVPLLLDAVSSFGAEEIQFENWNISGCAATANKCLHGVPGISFSIIRRDCIKEAHQPKSLYLDLANYLKQQDIGGTPFTQSVQVLYALDEALNEHTELGGWKSRQHDYRLKMELLNKSLNAIHIKSLLNPSDSSCVLATYYLPKGRTYPELHDYLKQNGFVIYSGQGYFATKVFRLSLMGAVSKTDIEKLTKLIREFVDE